MKTSKKHELAEKIADLVVATLDEGPIETSRSFLPIGGLSSMMIEPLQIAIIPTRVQVPFRGDRLAVWSKVAADFFIHGIRVGNRALGAQAGPMPADAFATRLDLLPLLDQQLNERGMVEIRISKLASECFGQPIAFPKCHAATDIYVTVENVSDAPKRFVGVILGDEEGYSR